jgi:hypothetical protein
VLHRHPYHAASAVHHLQPLVLRVLLHAMATAATCLRTNLLCSVKFLSELTCHRPPRFITIHTKSHRLFITYELLYRTYFLQHAIAAAAASLALFGASHGAIAAVARRFLQTL